MHAFYVKTVEKNSIVSTTAFASLKMSKFGKVYHGVLRGPPENLFALLQYLANGLHVFLSYQHIHVHVPLCQLYRWQEKTVPWLKSALSFLNCSKFLFFFLHSAHRAEPAPQARKAEMEKRRSAHHRTAPKQARWILGDGACLRGQERDLGCATGCGFCTGVWRFCFITSHHRWRQYIMP